MGKNKRKRARVVKWSQRELSVLHRLRKSGMSVQTIVDSRKYLKRRSYDSIAQQCRRQKWVNPEQSAACKKAKRFTDDAHEMFVKFLRNHGEAPYEQLIMSWNHSASLRDWPQLTPARLSYWLKKLGIDHSWGKSFRSNYSVQRRKKKRAEQFVESCAELERRALLEVEARKLEAARLRSRSRRVKTQRCGHCENEWPLNEKFFAHIPNVFALEGERLSGFQIEYCRFCRLRDDWTLRLFRAHGKDVTHILEERRTALRGGLELVWEDLRKKYLVKARAIFRTRRYVRTRECIRCGELWPLERPYFRVSRRTTLRSLCVFCDGWYERQIDRVARDGKSAAALRKERSHYLALARQLSRTNGRSGLA